MFYQTLFPTGNTITSCGSRSFNDCYIFFITDLTNSFCTKAYRPGLTPDHFFLASKGSETPRRTMSESPIIQTVRVLIDCMTFIGVMRSARPLLTLGSSIPAHLWLWNKTLAGDHKSPLDMAEILCHDGRSASLMVARLCH